MNVGFALGACKCIKSQQPWHTNHNINLLYEHLLFFQWHFPMAVLKGAVHKQMPANLNELKRHHKEECETIWNISVFKWYILLDFCPHMITWSQIFAAIFTFREIYNFIHTNAPFHFSCLSVVSQPLPKPAIKLMCTNGILYCYNNILHGYSYFSAIVVEWIHSINLQNITW